MGSLYMVATPIGNLGDMTYRGIEILKSVDLIVAEDTRRTKILCDHYEIKGQSMTSFHAKTPPSKALSIIEKIKKGQKVAFVSDAGTPCVSDPGFLLVREAVKNDIIVYPIPGASALTAMISAGGMPTDKFVFHGFLPHKKGRQTLIKSFNDTKISHIFYESVHRFARLLEECSTILGSDRVICVGKELTKIHECIFRGSIEEAKNFFDAGNTKGEFVIIVAPKNF